jgi:hypothetical protein
MSFDPKAAEARRLADKQAVASGAAVLFLQGAGLDRAGILEAARQAVTVDRAATHGSVENTFGQIAALWSARLGQTISPAQVCIMLVDLKTARAWGNPAHADNWVDIAGYAACGGELSKAMGDV